jgi:hypothetical protein
MGEMRKEALFIAGYRNRSRWWRCAKIVEKRFFNVFAKLRSHLLKENSLIPPEYC